MDSLNESFNGSYEDLSNRNNWPVYEKTKRYSRRSNESRSLKSSVCLEREDWKGLTMPNYLQKNQEASKPKEKMSTLATLLNEHFPVNTGPTAFIRSDQCVRTTFSFTSIDTIFEAECQSWTNKIWTKINIDRGWINCVVPQTTAYGPRRFYIRLFENSSIIPGRIFTHFFQKYGNRNFDIQAHGNIVANNYSGYAIYIDQVADAQTKYHPVYITRNDLPPHPISIYFMETGEMTKVTRKNQHQLVIMPSRMRNYIFPLALPCRMENPKMTSSDWHHFIRIVSTKNVVHVSCIANGELQISYALPDPLIVPHDPKCTNFVCDGMCEIENDGWSGGEGDNLVHFSN